MLSITLNLDLRSLRDLTKYLIASITSREKGKYPGSQPSTVFLPVGWLVIRLIPNDGVIKNTRHTTIQVIRYFQSLPISAAGGDYS